jgi:hypothetical protein
LTAQDQIFGFDRSRGSDRKHRQADKVGEQQQNESNEGGHSRIVRQ